MSSDKLPPSTPLDVRRGVTEAAAVAHPLLKSCVQIESHAVHFQPIRTTARGNIARHPSRVRCTIHLLQST